MKLVSQAISDLKMEFEGGAALSVDWYAILRRAANNVLDNISPDTLKRRLSLYGGLAKDLFLYHCPDDLEAPADIYENDGRFGNQQISSRKYTFAPPAAFYAKQEYNQYTIENINGVRFLVIRHTQNLAITVIEEAESAAGITSDQTLSLNQHNYITGTGALQRIFSPETGIEFTADFNTDTLTSIGHGLNNGDRIMLFFSDTLPASLAARIVYFVINKTADTFQVSLTSGGAAVNFTDNGTGTHKWHNATQNEISKTITAIDISDYLKGIVLVPIWLDNVAYVNRIEFVLETDTGNYYTLTSTADDIGENFISGCNMVRFWMANAVSTGTPSNIVKWRLRVVLNNGATAQTTIIDKITIQKTTHSNIEYTSNRMFVDGTTQEWKDTPVNGDYINLNRIALDILHYEAVILITQTSSFLKISQEEFKNFTNQLARKYEQYFARFPSSDEPLSYSHAREFPNDEMESLGNEQLNVEVQE